MKVVFICTLFISNIALADTFSCDNPGGYAAAHFLIDFTQSNGKSIASSACHAGKEEFCSLIAQEKFGIEQVFHLMKNYPAASSSEGCRAIRSECYHRCDDSGAFDPGVCGESCGFFY